MEHYLPTNTKRQYYGLARTPDGLTWECPTCGVIEPKELFLAGKVRYVRASCACERKAARRAKEEEEAREWLTFHSTRTYSWLGERWSDMALLEKRFATFEQARQQEAYEVTRLFLEVGKGSLVLHGTFGTGKTHLLAALCNEALRSKRMFSLFTTAPKLFSAIQARISADEDYSRLITAAIKTPLLVIDDIDKAKHTDFREEIYFEIIDERVKAGRPTAISTNKLAELERFVGGAVCSRLKVGQMAVEMIGTDYREGLEAWT